MTTLQLVICDDEYDTIATNKNVLTEYLTAQKLPYELTCFDDGQLCLEYCQENKVDILFLDIFLNNGQMGTEVARQLRTFDQDIKLIFLSSSNEFATESFAVDASYYLLKPLTTDKLETALSRCGLLQPVSSIAIDTGREIIRINPAVVIALEVLNKYTFVHTTNGIIKVLCPLSKFTEHLHEPDFLMTNRSFVINLNYVEDATEEYFLMQNGFKAPITTRNSKALRTKYIEWMFQHM